MLACSCKPLLAGVRAEGLVTVCRKASCPFCAQRMHSQNCPTRLNTKVPSNSRAPHLSAAWSPELSTWSPGGPSSSVDVINTWYFTAVGTMHCPLTQVPAASKPGLTQAGTVFRMVVCTFSRWTPSICWKEPPCAVAPAE